VRESPTIVRQATPPRVCRALLLTPLAASATFVAIPTLMAALGLTESSGAGAAVAVAVMVGLSFGLLALGASVIVTLGLYLGTRTFGIDLARQPLWLLLCVGGAAAVALVAGGRVWLADEVEWAMLWIAVPAGLAGAVAFFLSVRSRADTRAVGSL
jgi:hypothetical protein